jgi:hypothetical protein
LHYFRTSARALIAIAAIVLTVAACAQAAGEGDTGDLSIAIAAPSSGAQVSVPFEVQLDASGPLGEPGTGNHHAHLYFDTDTSSADYDIVYGNTWQVTRNLAPGEHRIIAALANPDHSLAGPTQEITVVVGDGGSGGGAGGGDQLPPAPTVGLPGY